MGECIRITGVMVQYYFACRRELWFFSRGLNFDFDNDDMLIGRMIHGDAYQRDWKEVLLEGARLDVVRKRDGLQVIEVKKSSKLEEPARWQLKYYLYLLLKAGVRAKGLVSYPKEGTAEEVELTGEDVGVLEEAFKGIEKVISLESPPKAEKKPYCKRCAYRDFCWV
ncbi:MAG: CRISPR-associated exonuclease Cas4 [Thermococcaceae archaeon]|jgi:CRISPR-associated exonuclease Cas4|uniref:CRISPR-associated protein Cas4 n=1 Tax=Thermococcus sp. PK TaxID=913025 RepID=UPI0005B2D0A6|nr:CRISPR-associated protein Cas4 [Thermococcus sp. PK]MDK2915441.1 CRISPR-associated exonuclease Cas4 [Thermococcaceae archaeon]